MKDKIPLCVNCRHDHHDSFQGKGPQPFCMDLDYNQEGQPDKACDCRSYVVITDKQP